MNSKQSRLFSARLKEAFNNAKNVDIAKKLGVGPSAITNYSREERYPSLDILLKISEVTGYSIQWLLTGEGPKKISPRDESKETGENSICVNFSTQEKNIIDTLASDAHQTVEQTIYEIVRASLILSGLSGNTAIEINVLRNLMLDSLYDIQKRRSQYQGKVRKKG
jgi:transcriptional regulator with XRE-family HTH domain